MYSFRRLALLLALGLPALHFVQAQSSSSNPAATDPAQAPTTAPSQSQTQSQVSVQARIRQRREQRRAAAIHEVYDHLYEGYVGGGYLRTHVGTPQRVNLYDWDAGFSRYFSERLGVTLDGRGYYGTPFVGLNLSGITKPAISEYTAMIGPTYRVYIQPRFSVSVRALGGFAQGNFSADTNGFGSTTLGMYKDGTTYALNGSVIAEYNVAPNLGVRLAPEYMFTGFGSTEQNSLGFTGGLVYRFGKQR